MPTLPDRASQKAHDVLEFIETGAPDFVGTGAPDFVETGAPECNWGQLTSRMIVEEGWDQGAHASDPSGDGRGPEERVGLANVVEKGNLHATCELIESLLEG